MPCTLADRFRRLVSICNIGPTHTLVPSRPLSRHRYSRSKTLVRQPRKFCLPPKRLRKRWASRKNHANATERALDGSMVTATARMRRRRTRKSVPSRVSPARRPSHESPTIDTEIAVRRASENANVREMHATERTSESSRNAIAIQAPTVNGIATAAVIETETATATDLTNEKEAVNGRAGVATTRMMTVTVTTSNPLRVSCAITHALAREQCVVTKYKYGTILGSYKAAVRVVITWFAAKARGRKGSSIHEEERRKKIGAINRGGLGESACWVHRMGVPPA